MSQAHFQYASEEPVDFDILTGDTVLFAWKRNARAAGASPDRAVTFKAGGEHIDPNERPIAGRMYVATVNLEDKGM